MPTSLTSQESLVLAAMSERARYGYELAERIAELTDGRVRIRPGNLYRIIDRLIDGGLAEEADCRGPDEDERRRYFRATAAGKQAAHAHLAMYGRVLDRVGLDQP